MAQDYAYQMHEKSRTQHLGSVLAAHYKPYELVVNPPRPQDITLELLLASQAHIGHATSLWNPGNSRYIYGIRGNKEHGEGPIHIISLEATAAHLRRACKVVSGVTERGGLVLFVGTREGQARSVVKAASLSKGCHLFTKWIPGSITNGQQILGKCAKKVVDEFDNEVPGFEDQLGTKAAVKPDLVVCLNPLENYILLHECGLNNIPTIGVIDTDANPTWVTYPIPANDDSLRAVQVIVGALGRAGQEGQEKRRALAEQGRISYNVAHGLQPPKKREASSRQPQKREQRQAQQPRQSRQTQQTVQPAPAPIENDDFEYIDPKQEEEYGKKLEATYPESKQAQALNPALTPEQSDTASTAASQTSQAPGSRRATPPEEDEEEEDEEHDEDEDDSDSPADIHTFTNPDPSLTTETFPPTSSSTPTSNDDLSQFGGADQLSTHSRSAAEQDEEAFNNLQAQFADEDHSSPIEQAGEVEKELGEDEYPEVDQQDKKTPPDMNTPDTSEVDSGFERGSPGEGVKPEPPVNEGDQGKKKE